MKIKGIDFNETSIKDNKSDSYASNWPVVYILKGNKEAYVGETTNFNRRMFDHLNNPVRKTLSKAYMVSDDRFNKSATLDIESMLIESMSADGKFLLQNSNRGLKDHNYYNKNSYTNDFTHLWESLIDEKLANNRLRDIRNSDIFKLSPYKRLTEEQYDIAETIERYVLSEDKSQHIIKGEPGTGKTVLAVFLVKYLLSNENFENKKVALVVPMSSLRRSIKKVFKNIKGLSSSMVIGPYDVIKGEKYDLLIVDEAHRLNRRKNLSNYGAYDKVCRHLNLEPKEATQLDWINQSSNHTILFYDKNQTVKPTDIQKNIFENFDGNVYSLNYQFRVQAGEDYTQYIDDILNQRGPKKIILGKYDLKIFNHIDEMVNKIKMLDEQYGLCRTVAGYAWKWESQKDKNSFDIYIEQSKYRWNSTSEDWINSANAINEIGCIHTVQGYDLNYCGVIIGSDLIYRNGKIKYNSEAYKDINAKDLTLSDNEMLDFITNIYKVLLTRGIMGTFLYVCDDALKRYLTQYFDTL